MPDGNTSANPCIPSFVVLDACAVLTGEYSGNGRLFRDKEGRDPVPASHYLEAGGYFYVLNHQAQWNYPLFDSFDVWVPPPRQLVPDHWFSPARPKEQAMDPSVASAAWSQVGGNTRSVLSDNAQTLDGQCLISGYPEPLRGSHIIPVEYHRWYTAHKVDSQLYYPTVFPTRLTETIHDIRNFLTLRDDLHRLWDDQIFTFIPADGFFVPCFIGLTPNLYADEFHFRKVECHERIDPYLLFNQFAMAIFTLRIKLTIFTAHPSQTKSMKSSVKKRRSARHSARGSNLETTDESDDDAIQMEGDHAAWIPVDKNIEATKAAWFAAHPQIRQRTEDITCVE